jgi:hypothetical protein
MPTARQTFICTRQLVNNTTTAIMSATCPRYASGSARTGNTPTGATGSFQSGTPTSTTCAAVHCADRTASIDVNAVETVCVPA